MIRAASHGHADMVKMLLQAGADISATNKRGFTSLHVAARCNRAATVSTLLQAGAYCNAVCSKGRTSLHWAVDANALDAVTLLLEVGAEADTADNDGYTPMDLATEKKYLFRNNTIISKLILAGATFELDLVDINGLLEWAARNGDSEVVLVMLKCEAVFDKYFTIGG